MSEVKDVCNVCPMVKTLGYANRIYSTSALKINPPKKQILLGKRVYMH